MRNEVADRRNGTRAERDRLHRLAAPAERFLTSRVLILDEALCHEVIRRRQELGIDRFDEVWEGVYVVSPLANNPHQKLVGGLSNLFGEVMEPLGAAVLPGANVSDRREGWEHSFRDPDIVVVLPDGRAVDCTTHYWGGPDFLVEVRSPGDQTREKLPFYSQIKVQELLVVDRDSRRLELYRHDGAALVLIGESSTLKPVWLTSSVLPLAFRWTEVKGDPRTAVKRTDKKRKTWTV